MLNKEHVRYGRKFDLGDYQSLDLSVDIWATIVDQSLVESILPTLWQMAKNNLRYVYLIDQRGIQDPTTLVESLVIEPPTNEAFVIDTISVAMGKKIRCGGRYENAEIHNSLWYNLDANDDYATTCTALWQSVLNNVAAANPNPVNPMRYAKLGVDNENSTPPVANVLSSDSQTS